MKDKPILGIDMAKLTFHYSLQSPDGRLLESRRWENTTKGIADFIGHLQNRVPGGCGHLRAGLEATGRYGHALFLALHQAGAWVSVINPAQIKYFGASLNQRGKNDPMDAALIARYVRERNPRATVPATASLVALKELVGEIDSLIEESVRLENRRAEVGSACPQVAASLRKRQNLVAKEIQRLEKVVGDLIGGDARLARDQRLLCSITGIAQRTAARLLAHLAEKNFDSARQMASYAGLSPAQNTSGTSLRGPTRMCKTGNGRLRKALYLPAMTLWRHCHAVRSWADAIALRTGSKKAALGAVMRKLIHIVFGVLKHQKPFNENLVSSPVPTA